MNSQNKSQINQNPQTQNNSIFSNPNSQTKSSQSTQKIDLKELAKELVKAYSVEKFRETVLGLKLSIEEIEKLEEEIKRIDYGFWERLMGDVDLDDEEEFDDSDYVNVPELGYDPCEEDDCE